MFLVGIKDYSNSIKFLMFDWPIAALNTFCAECERAALQKSWTKLHPELTQMCQKQELGSV